MAEFLKDNIEVEKRRRELPQEVLWHPCCRLLSREGKCLTSWAGCSVSGCIQASCQRPTHTWDEDCGLTRLIVREARRSGGTGWQEYDSMFRQQEVSATDLKWESVNNALYAMTFAAPQPVSQERSYPWAPISSAGTANIHFISNQFIAVIV